MTIEASRERFGLFQDYLERDLHLRHIEAIDIYANIYEIDEDCEKLLAIIHKELLTALEDKDSEKISKALIDYDIRIDHMEDHIVNLLKALPKAMKQLGIDSISKDN